jgi:Family of unknown function (DUF6600)/FecR protein
MKKRIAILTALLLSLFLVLPISVRSQDEEEQPEPPEEQAAEAQPDQGVGRVSLINGNVTTQRGDSGDWVAATVNQPIVKLDQLMTAEHSRTEVQLDYGHTLRLAEKTTVRIADLTPSNIQVQIATGAIDFSIYPDAQGNVEIDTPNMAVHPTEPGFYRVEVTSDSQTQMIVYQGHADVSTQQGSVTVDPGQIIMVQGTDNPQYQTDRAPAESGFDRWALDRDRQMLSAQNYQHTDRYYTGGDELDRNGQWEQVPGYDWCWTPSVDAGWVPYNDGRWVYEPYWGWTWVSYEPWGWAPYHYGRWFYYSNRWCWWPGPVRAGYRPIWAPAYVSFIGFGFGGRHMGFGMGFGFGNIGWVPLGPADRYHPWWGGHNSYNVVNFNSIHNERIINGGNYRHRPVPLYGSNLRNALTNEHVRQAIRTVPSNEFGTGARNYRPVSAETLRQGQMIHGTLPVVPTKASFGDPARISGFSSRQLAAANNPHFYTRNSVTPQRNFNEHVSSIQQMMRRDTSPASNMRRATMGGEPVRSGGFQTNRGAVGGAKGTVGGNASANASRDSQRSWEKFGKGAAQARPFEGNRSNAAGPQGHGNANAPGDTRNGWEGTVQRPSNGSSGRSNGSVDWQKFPGRPAPSEGVRGNSAPRTVEPPQRSEPSRGGVNWNRFPSMGRANNNNNRAWSAPRSDSSGRAPLTLGKPIVTDRPSGARNSGWSWGGNRGGNNSRPAPQQKERGGWGGGGNGGGHSRPVPESRGGWGHSGGGGHSSGHSGGGSHGRR